MLFEVTGVIYAVERISRKTGNLFRNYQVKVSVFRTGYHSVKLFPLFCARSRNAFIGKNLIQLPIWIALDILPEIALLAFK